MHKRISFLILFVSICLTSCTKENEITVIGPTYTTGKFHEESQQKEFIKLLVIENIKYDLMGDHYRFSINDTAKVLGLKRIVLYGEKLSTNIEEGIIVQGDSMRNEYENPFKEADIPYWIDDIHGASDAWSISYWQIYGPQADLINQRLEIAYHKRRKSS